MADTQNLAALAAVAFPEGAPHTITVTRVADQRLQFADRPATNGPMTPEELQLEKQRESRLTPAQILQERAAALRSMLQDPNWGRAMRLFRRQCMHDDMTKTISEMRQTTPVTPDAADYCIATLMRTMRDGHLLVPYQEMVFADASKNLSPSQTAALLLDTAQLEKQGQDPAKALPQQIADAIREGKSSVRLPHGTEITITSGMAFDVGFLGGYSNKGENRPGHFKTPDFAKAAATRCQTQSGDNKTCFVAGYIHGADAYVAMPPVTPLPAQPLVTSMR